MAIEALPPPPPIDNNVFYISAVDAQQLITSDSTTIIDRAHNSLLSQSNPPPGLNQREQPDKITSTDTDWIKFVCPGIAVLFIAGLGAAAYLDGKQKAYQASLDATSNKLNDSLNSNSSGVTFTQAELTQALIKKEQDHKKAIYTAVKANATQGSNYSTDQPVTNNNSPRTGTGEQRSMNSRDFIELSRRNKRF
jgi:hypothetical protein